MPTLNFLTDWPTSVVALAILQMLYFEAATISDLSAKTSIDLHLLAAPGTVYVYANQR